MYGYIICVSSKRVPQVLMVGHTFQSPALQLHELNRRVPGYSLQYAVKVRHSPMKFQCLHTILVRYYPQIHEHVFKMSVDEIRPLLDLLDGYKWPNDNDTKHK